MAPASNVAGISARVKSNALFVVVHQVQLGSSSVRLPAVPPLEAWLKVKFRQRVGFIGKGNKDSAKIRPVLEIQLHTNHVTHHVPLWSLDFAQSPLSLVCRTTLEHPT